MRYDRIRTPKYKQPAAICDYLTVFLAVAAIVCIAAIIVVHTTGTHLTP